MTESNDLNSHRVPLWKILRDVIALPFVVTIVIPVVILTLVRAPDASITLSNPVMVTLGGVFLITGISLLASTVRLLATIGKGTLAPWGQTRRLVVEGPYRFVRNPMITGVISILLGESLVMGSIALGVWAATFALLNAVAIPLYEEPRNRRVFGLEWDKYKRHVPRWLPRFTPWAPEIED